MSNLETYYESPNISDDEANVKALELLRQFDGLPVPVVRQVLRQAEFWLSAVTVLDCGPTTEFARAFEGWKGAAQKPVSGGTSIRSAAAYELASTARATAQALRAGRRAAQLSALISDSPPAHLPEVAQ